MLEFLKKFVMPTIDIDIMKDMQDDTEFTIRSKQFFIAYNNDLS